MPAPIAMPDCIRAATEHYEWTKALAGQSGASVYRLEKRGEPTLYVKFGTGKVAEDIIAEIGRLQWLASNGFVANLHQFFYFEEQAWLLTTAVPGRSAYDCLVSNPRGRAEIVKALAVFLQKLHSLPLADCPFKSDHELRMAEARRNMDSSRVDESDFDLGHEGWSAEQVWTEMQSLLTLSFDRVVTHGDFSLDNVFLEHGRVTGCIDVGRAGAADPYQDLATLWRDLREFGEDLQTGLFEAYGIKHLDARKLQYHLCLDEFF